MDIFVDPVALRAKSDDIRIVNGDLRVLMENIEILVLSVNGSWQGDAEKAYAEKILFIKNQFEPIAMFFDDYSDLLKKFADEYESQESDMASKINLV